MFNGKCLPFYFKFSENEFLRLSIGSNYLGSYLGEKLAALSDFYEVLSQEFGEPNVFYTIKDDNEGLLSLQWSFINKEKDIESFKNGTYFDDAKIDKLVIIGEKEAKTNQFQLRDNTKKALSKLIGLPFELISLADEDIENFVKFKTGKEMMVPEDAKIDRAPVVPFEKKLVLEQNKKR